MRVDTLIHAHVSAHSHMSTQAPLQKKMRNKKYGSLATQFKSLLAHPNEIWDVYEVYKHKFPSSLACKKYCGVIITGSEATAHDRNHSDWKWIQQTRDLCQSFYDRRVPIIGYCFGHQMLAGLFGGESGRAKGVCMSCVLRIIVVVCCVGVVVSIIIMIRAFVLILYCY